MTNSGYNPDFYPAFAELEEKNFWFWNRRALFVWALKKYFPKAKNFLDIGCGMGYVLQGIRQACPDLELHGSDLYDQNLKFAARRVNNANLFESDILSFNKTNAFDVIGAFDVLEHIREDEEALARLYRGLRPEGGLLISVPQHPFLWSYFDEKSRHVRRYNSKDLIEKTKRAGFEVLRCTSFVSFLLPLLILVRNRKPRSGGAAEILNQLEIPSFVNAVMGGICAFERKLIRTGASFGAGGSLLLIAKKKN